jgi:hypothetical protein
MPIPAREQPIIILGILALVMAWGLVRVSDFTQPSQREKEEFLGAHLRTLLPERPVQQLNERQEAAVLEMINEFSGIPTVAQLDYRRLNYIYGWMGAEQHLLRFPGDRLTWKDELPQAGMAPGVGSFGYFAPSRGELTWEKYLEEKYYVAVQTLYLDTWNQEWWWLKDWYKFRKVLVVNPENGKAVVAVIGDAGPALFTGKQFGGSPEVMARLGLYGGRMKGIVLLLFIDGGEREYQEVPLGPVKYGG